VILSLLRRRRRARLLAAPFPDEWVGYLERNVPLYSRLPERDKARLRDTLRVLVAEKHWEGCGGLVMTDEVKVTIAAHAALLLLGIDHDYFARVLSILVYPSGFRSPEGWQRPDGTVDMSVGALGEAWYDGPIVLAWDAVLAGARDAAGSVVRSTTRRADGRNVVLHEFAHQLDYLDGVSDGTPPLRTQADYRRWQEVMTREYERLVRESETGRPQVLDGYGATSHAEFFAVATEAFFERSREMCARHPELYAVLSQYYGQDPVALDRPAASLSESPPAPAEKKSYRGSRRAAKVAAHATTATDWPWWVTFWEIHPGMAREQALRPLEHHVGYIIGAACLVLVGVGVCYLKDWRPYLSLLLPVAFFLTMVGFAAWLRLAVRWVDRHGAWGGEYRPPQPAPEDTPAPPG
jgi:Mlc titration factor MtfA (ptsG expression regulator)